MPDYEEKLPSELPLGSYDRDPADRDQLEMAIWGRALDRAELENAQLLEGIASPVYAPVWMVERYEREYQIVPDPGASLPTRQAAVVAAMGKRRNLSASTMQKVANGFLGYFPVIKTSPHAFYCGSSTFDSGHKLVADHIKFAFWVQLQHLLTAKPYDDTNLIAALKAASPAEVTHIWTYWDDEAFDWNAYNP
jgi:hypothetical protein